MYFNKKLHQLLENLNVACYYETSNFCFDMDILYNLKKPFARKFGYEV